MEPVEVVYKKNFLFPVILVLIILVSGIGAYFFLSSQNNSPENDEEITVSPNPTPTLAPTPTSVPEEAQAVNVVVLNGTSVAGLASRTKGKLAEEFQNIEVVSVGDATGNYDSTLVVDIRGTHEEIVQELATFLDGEVGEFPSEEDEPDNADILVIVGQ